VRPAEANRTGVRQAISPNVQALVRMMRKGTSETRVLVRRGEKASVGPTHRAQRER